MTHSFQRIFFYGDLKVGKCSQSKSSMCHGCFRKWEIIAPDNSLFFVALIKVYLFPYFSFLSCDLFKQVCLVDYLLFLFDPLALNISCDFDLYLDLNSDNIHSTEICNYVAGLYIFVHVHFLKAFSCSVHGILSTLL